jgi:sugar lactone lactonase YvrE
MQLDMRLAARIPLGFAAHPAGKPDIHVSPRPILWRLVVLTLSASIPAIAQQTITTYAGVGPMSGPALSIPLPGPTDVKADTLGNFYICMTGLHIVYRLDTAGNLAVIAGTGVAGYSGDNGQGINATLSFPTGLALDKLGNLYIADSSNYRVRKLSLATGVITTVAGNGLSTNICASQPCTDDGVAPTTVPVSPWRLAVDNSNNLYIADSFSRVRKVVGATIATVAGTAQSPMVATDIAIDSMGTLYIADATRAVVYKVVQGVISLAVGTGQRGDTGDGGPALVQVVESVGCQRHGRCQGCGIRKVATGAGDGCDLPGAHHSDLARLGTGGIVQNGVPATHAFIEYAIGLTFSTDNDLVFADILSSRVRRITGGIVNTIAGNGQTYSSGEGVKANTVTVAPDGTSMALDSAGSLYFVESSSHRVRKISREGIVTTVAGNGQFGFSGDNGPAAEAQLGSPGGVAVGSDGRVYIADTGNFRVRVVDRSGTITTFAGTGDVFPNGEGLSPLKTNLNGPVAVAVDSAGTLYIAESQADRVLKVSGGIVTRVAGTGNLGPLDQECDTGPAIATGHLTGIHVNPSSLALDPSGTLYFTGAVSHCIRRLINGNLELVAGGYTPGFSDGPVEGARFSRPKGLSFDAAGNLYVADSSNNRVRRIANGRVTTVAGDGSPVVSFGGDGGSPTRASLFFPSAVASDPNGSLFIADTGNFRIREVSNGARRAAPHQPHR